MDAAKFYLERFGERLERYATIWGYKRRSDDSQKYKDSRMAEAKKDLAKCNRRVADGERLMAEYKKKYDLNLG